MNDNRQLYCSEAAYLRQMSNYEAEVKSWEVQPESFYVDTRYGKTHVLRAGDISKPALVFFHGWSGNAAGTRSELDLARLTKHFCIYSPDTIGQSGKSAPSRPETSASPYADWIVDVFEGLELTEAYISGISGGGYLSLKAASYLPDKVKSAFLMSSAGVVSLSRPPVKFLAAAIPALLGFQWAARNFVKQMVSPFYQDEKSLNEMAIGMQLMISQMKPVSGPKALPDEELRRIQCPVCIVMGKYDNAIPPIKTIERAVRLIPNIKTQLIDAGHIMTMEKRDWLMDELLRFFGME